MTTKSNRLSRRTFLEGLGLSGALLPLVGTDQVLAAPGGTPKRVLFVTWSNGYVMDDWRPKGTETEFTFGETLKALTPYKDKMIVVDGVGPKVHFEANAKALGWGKDQYYGGHDGYPGVLTGVPLSKYADFLEWSGGDSMDVHIGKELMKQAQLPFDSLVVGPFAQGSYNGTTSYRGASPGVTPEKSPFNLHTKLFEGRNLPKADLEKILGARKSMLDYLGKTLTAFGQKLGTDDRRRIDAHLESIRAVEKQLQAGGAPPAAGAAACAAPDASVKFDPAKEYPKALTLFSDVLVSAFQCDLARVGNLIVTGSGGDNLMFSWLGAEFTGKGDEYPTRQYHDITHNQGRSADHKRRKIRVEQWFFEQVAYIVKKLADTRDAAGTPMLDNTLVVVTNSMCNNHDSKVQPFTLIGNLGGYFKTGRFLKYANEAHNKLLVTVANGAGVDGASWGAKHYATELGRLRG